MYAQGALDTKDFEVTYDLDLYTLRRQDPSIASIISRCGYVRCEFDAGVVIGGLLVVYEREIYATRGFAILNDRNVMFMQDLSSEAEICIDKDRVVVILDDSASVHLLTDEDNILVVSSCLQIVIQESSFIPKKPLSKLDAMSSVTSLSSPTSRFESPPSSPSDSYPRTSISSQSSPTQSLLFGGEPTKSPSPRQRGKNSDSSRLALLHKIFGPSSSGIVSEPSSPSRSSLGDWTDVQDLTSRVSKCEQSPFAYGNFSDMFKGRVWDGIGYGLVAIKVVRIPGFSDQFDWTDIRARLDHEVRVWSRLRHPNVVPLLGICHNLGRFSGLVSPYYPSSNVVHYLAQNPSASRHRMLLGITSGLEYLHSQGFIHGKFKPRTIAVDASGHPLICGLGVPRPDDPCLPTRPLGASQYIAPELFPDEDADDEDIQPSITMQADVYAYGIIGLQVLTGQEPPCRLRKPLAPMSRRVFDPQHRLMDSLWEALEECCRLKAKERPAMNVVKQRLGTLLVTSSHRKLGH